MVRFFRSIFLYATLMFTAGATWADDRSTVLCPGQDMLADLQKTDPTTYAHIDAEAERISNGGAILWRIDGNGAPKPSWLFGTMHLTDPRIHALSDPVKDAFAAADILALEVAGISDINKAALKLLQIRSQIMLPRNQTLEARLTPAEIELLKAQSARLSMHGEVLIRMQPWFLWISLGMSACEMDQLKGGKRALDARLEVDALKSGKRVDGLETFESQMQAIASMPEAVQLDALRVILKAAPHMDSILETMKRLYLQRRINTILPFSRYTTTLYGGSIKSHDAAFSILLDKRNIGMRDKALPLIAQGGAFIAVGAGHLPGKNGLVALLRQAGYTVTPVD